MPEKADEERRWLSELSRGDVEALGAVYDAYARQLYAYARSLGSSEASAEDILQEVFLRLLRRAPKCSRIKSLAAYLFAMTRREFYRWGRRLLRRREIEPHDSAALFECAAQNSSVELVESLEEAISRLPRFQREVVMMKVFGGLTFEEIAEVMETSVNTAASRYRYAKEKLKKVLS